ESNHDSLGVRLAPGLFVLDTHFHFTHSPFHAYENRLADDAVPDVQFDHPVDPRDGLYVAIIQSVTCMQLDAGGDDQGRGRPQGFEFGPAPRPLGAIGVASRVELDRRHAELEARLEL